MPEYQHTIYLGDSVYAGYDGYQVWLWTENGMGPNQNPIAIEPGVMSAFVAFYKRCAGVTSDAP